MRRKIMRMVTDSTPVEAPKNPDSCNVFALYKLFASAAETQALRKLYTDGGMGYGTAKQMLFEKYWAYFEPFRRRRAELLANPDYVERILQDGGRRARHVADETLRRVRTRVGLA